jgi:ABC-2 type transport system ATP-binding protein
MERTADAPPPLAIEGLTVRYGQKVGVADVHLTVRPGEIYGLLGSNGAGKSTTIKCVAGLLVPDAGSVRVFGLAPAGPGVEAKRRIGYVPEAAQLFDALTPWEFLEFIAGVRGLDAAAVNRRATRYAEALELTDELQQPILTLSTGNRQKVLLIAALIHRPALLVLDEPFHSLDPRAVRVARELLRHYVEGGRAGVLLSTHTMEVAERLCDRVGILDRGRLVAQGTIPELTVGSGEGLEEAFLRLTRAAEGVPDAVRSLGAE